MVGFRHNLLASCRFVWRCNTNLLERDEGLLKGNQRERGCSFAWDCLNARGGHCAFGTFRGAKLAKINLGSHVMLESHVAACDCQFMNVKKTINYLAVPGKPEQCRYTNATAPESKNCKRPGRRTRTENKEMCRVISHLFFFSLYICITSVKSELHPAAFWWFSHLSHRREGGGTCSFQTK